MGHASSYKRINTDIHPHPSIHACRQPSIHPSDFCWNNPIIDDQWHQIGTNYSALTPQSTLIHQLASDPVSIPKHPRSQPKESSLAWGASGSVSLASALHNRNRHITQSSNVKENVFNKVLFSHNCIWWRIALKENGRERAELQDCGDSSSAILTLLFQLPSNKKKTLRTRNETTFIVLFDLLILLSSMATNRATRISQEWQK